MDFEDITDGYYYIINVDIGEYLGVAESNVVTGTKIMEYSMANTDDQI